MSLIGRYSVLSKSIGVRRGGTTQSGDRSNFGKTNSLRNRYVGGFARFNALPSGYLPPYAWVMPQISGGMASFTRITASISTTTASIAAGRNIEADLTASISVTNATAQLAVLMAAALSASGSITTAQLKALLSASANLTASGSITTANLGALAKMVASLVASGTITTSTLRALGHMSADILPYTELSPESLSRAVWSTALAEYTTAGTAGKKLNDVSGGGASLSDIEDAVWNALGADHQVAGSLAELIQRLLTRGQFLALK